MSSRVSYLILTEKKQIYSRFRHRCWGKVSKNTQYEMIVSILRSMRESACYYPYFDKWLEKVFFEASLGRRSVVIAKDRGQFAGICIVKHTLHKSKLCTCWVGDTLRHHAIGTYLLYLGALSLAGRNPLLSISGPSLGYFRTYIDNNIFVPCGQRDSLYQDNIREHFFTFSPESPATRAFFRARLPEAYLGVHNSVEQRHPPDQD